IAYAMAGAPERARAVLAQYGAAAHDSVNREAWRGHRKYTESLTLLAEGRNDDAIRAARRIDVDDDGLRTFCDFCREVMLARAFDQANAPDSTIAHLERYLAGTSPNRINIDTWMRGPAHKRLGELYE